MTAAALECLMCGRRETYEQFDLDDMVRVARQMGDFAHLNDARDAIAAICPDCGKGDCPDCGQSVADHQVRDRRVRCEHKGTP